MTKAQLKEVEYYDIGGTFLQETDEAILLDVDGDEVWLPKSQIEFDGERGDYIEVEVPDWLCEQKGLHDRDGIQPIAEGKHEARPPKPAFDPEALLEFDLFVCEVLEDGQVLVDVEDKDPIEISKYDIITADVIEAGETIHCQIKAGVALKAGLIENPSKVMGGNCNWLRKETLYHQFPLKEADKLELAEKMAKAQGEVDKLEEELAETRKSLKGQIDAFQGIIKEAARTLRLGVSEAVAVTCDVIQDWDTEELVWVSADEEHLELQRRKMTPEERQPSLFDKAPEAVDM